MRRITIVALAVLFAVPGLLAQGPTAPAPRIAVTKRHRVVVEDAAAVGAGSAKLGVRAAAETWDARQTAVIVCDMWNRHWCRGATARCGELAPRIDAFVRDARRRGATIVHAPSSCMKAYAGHPSRRRALETPRAKEFPAKIGDWCHSIPAEEKGKYPLDQSNGGCDCEPRCESFTAWERQIDAIWIDDGPSDVISDSGEEIWSVFEARRIEHVFLVGVHTNMCVLGRPFGLRNLAQNGKDVVLVRDLTDTMYDRRAWPYVSHFRGNELIVEHIEKWVCPTVTSSDLLGGTRFRFRGDERKRVVIAIAEDEYETKQTLPVFAHEVLEDELGLDVTIVHGEADDGPGRHRVPGLRAALEGADLLFVSMRRRALPATDLAVVRAHLAAGKALVGIRTASHAFDARGDGPEGHAEWRDFDPLVLGGNYQGHHGSGPLTKVTAVATAAGGDSAAARNILAGVELPFSSVASLYKTRPLAASTTALLEGTIPGEPSEPIAWTNRCGSAPVFYTSLGHVEDFANPAFRKLLANAVVWTLAARNAEVER